MNHIIGKCTVLEKNMRDPIIRYIGDVATAISWGGTGRVNIMQMREEREAHTECTKNQIGHQPLEIIKKMEIIWLRDYWSTRMLAGQHREDQEHWEGLQTRIIRSRSLDIASYTPKTLQWDGHINTIGQDVTL